MKILVTGKSSRFVKYLKNELLGFEVIYPNKKEFNILNYKQIEKFIKRKKISHLIHVAGLSRPMKIHETNIVKSIDLNIIGTSNIVKCCSKYNVKLIYFSTNYVYPGSKGNYNENDNLKPVNNYAWSKLGGESAVQLYKNSLILRLCMTDYPFIHKKAISGAISSFIFNKEVAKIIPFILNEKGILNIGGKKRDIYTFAKIFADKNIKKVSLKKIKNFPKNSSINIKKLNLLINKKIKIMY